MNDLEIVCTTAERFAAVRALWYAVVEEQRRFLVVFWDKNYYMFSPIIHVGCPNFENILDGITIEWGKYWRRLTAPYFTAGAPIAAPQIIGNGPEDREK
jgi:hypothetical protein